VSVSVIVHGVTNPKTILRTKEQDLNHTGILVNKSLVAVLIGHRSGDEPRAVAGVSGAVRGLLVIWIT
jgi:hypothetical protein